MTPIIQEGNAGKVLDGQILEEQPRSTAKGTPGSYALGEGRKLTGCLSMPTEEPARETGQQLYL